MAATIRQRDTGKTDAKGNPVVRYQVRWREPVRDEFGVPTGKHRQRGEVFATEEQANARAAAVDQALADMRLDPGEARNLAAKPLGQYATEWFDGLVGTVDSDTAAKYRAIYLLYIAPTLGGRAVASIRVSDVKKLRSELSQTTSKRTSRPLSAGTIKHAITVLRMILDTAVENEAIASNPAAVRLPSLRRQRDFTEGKRYTRLTVEQVATAANWISTEQPITVAPRNRKAYVTTKPGNPAYGLAVLFSVATGVRASELQGLEIGDVTLSEHRGTSGLVSVRRKKRPVAGWEPEPLKTANAYRDVPIDPWLADDLRDYLADVHADAGNSQAPLFPGRLPGAAARAQADARGQVAPTKSAERFDWSRPIDAANVYKRFWLPALDALGLPHSRWHDLRHAAAVSTLATENVRDVSRWLGHAKISTTMDIYAAVLKTENTGKASPSARPVPLPADNVVPLQRKAN